MIQNKNLSPDFCPSDTVQTRFPAGILRHLDEMIIRFLLVLLAFVQFEQATGKEWKMAGVIGEGSGNVGASDSH